MNNFTLNMMSNAYQSARTATAVKKGKTQAAGPPGHRSGKHAESKTQHSLQQGVKATFENGREQAGAGAGPRKPPMDIKPAARLVQTPRDENSERRERLQQAFIMAEVLKEPVSKRRHSTENSYRRRSRRV